MPRTYLRSILLSTTDQTMCPLLLDLILTFHVSQIWETITLTFLLLRPLHIYKSRDGFYRQKYFAYDFMLNFDETLFKRHIYWEYVWKIMFAFRIRKIRCACVFVRVCASTYNCRLYIKCAGLIKQTIKAIKSSLFV